MAKQFSEMYVTEQQRQMSGLLADMLDKIDSRFTDLEQKTQDKFRGAANEIARLRGDFGGVQSRYAERFRALADHYHRAGDYHGPFANREEAANFGRFVIAAITRDNAALAELERAGITPAKGAVGGYLSPDQLLAGILRNVELYGVFERNVPPTIVNVHTGGMATRTGGLTVYHPELETAATASEPSFGRIDFALKRWATLTLIDRWMMNDALVVALGDFIATEIGYALAYGQDLRAFVGDGTSTYGRVTGAFKRAGSGQLTVTGDSGDDTFAEMIAKSTYYLAKMMGKVPTWVHQAGPRWYMHAVVFFDYLGVRDSQGRPIADILQADRPNPFTLMGYPVELTQVAPSTTATETVFVLFGALARGWKLFRHVTGVEIRESEHYKFAEGQIAIAGDVVQDIQEADNQAYAQLKTAAS
jgi:HK97 family phage major capsid protein